MVLKFGQTVALTVAMAFAAGTALAQEISPSQLEAAARAAELTPQPGDFDALLPFASQTVQNSLIRQRPDLFREIATAVEGQALEIAGRRTDLDADVARAWARRFSEDELNQIAAFFGSELGTKYKAALPELGNEMLRLSRGWTNRLTEELLERSVQELAREGHEFN